MATQERGQKLPREFYHRSTVDVAIDLLGRRLVRVVSPATDAGSAELPASAPAYAGTIVETEAYVGSADLACHASRGRTRRTEVMFGPPGHAYVFLVYGLHYCLNAVTEREGFPAAVLIRAVEPDARVPGRTDGPGRLCRAFGIDRTFDAEDLTGNRLYVEAALGRPQYRLRLELFRSGPRIGVAYAGEWAARPWRFWLSDNPFVSRP